MTSKVEHLVVMFEPRGRSSQSKKLQQNRIWLAVLLLRTFVRLDFGEEKVFVRTQVVQ